MNFLYSRIRAERVKIGCRQWELAEYLNVTQATMSRWENGKADIPTSMVVELARLFHCTTDYLLGLSDRPE